jgi:hypothetical protein
MCLIELAKIQDLKEFNRFITKGLIFFFFFNSLNVPTFLFPQRNRFERFFDVAVVRGTFATRLRNEGAASCVLNSFMTQIPFPLVFREYADDKAAVQALRISQVHEVA